MSFQPPVAKLPQWVASFSIDACRERAGAPRSGSSETLWPIEVHNPDACCQVRRFGRGAESLVLFDGHLFGRAEMLQDLNGDPSTTVEADLVALAYQRWGEAVFERLNGRFLVAIWDAEARAFWLSHDAMGNHPVYFSVIGGKAWFSSNVLALAHSGVVQRRPNRLTFAMIVRRSRPPAGQTCFEGIERLPATCLLRWNRRDEGVQVRFWDPYPGDDAPYLSEEESRNGFEECFERAVADRLSLGANGIFLSGGLDSCTVAAAAVSEARRLGAPPVTAWAMQSHEADPRTYEDATQETVATALGLTLVKTSWYECLEGEDLIRASLRVTPRFSMPLWGYWLGGFEAVKERAASRGIDCLLTGSGGDEWFGVDPLYAADLVRRLDLRRLAHLVRLDGSGGWRGTAAAVRHAAWVHGLRAVLASAWMEVAPGSFRSFLQRRALERLGRRVFHSADGRPYPDDGIAERVRDVLVSRLASRVNPMDRFPRDFYREVVFTGWADSPVVFDREFEYHASRASGILSLSPFHDRRMAELAARIPQHTAMRHGRNKGLVREYADRSLAGLGLGDRSKTVVGNVPDRSYWLLLEGLPSLFDEIGCRRLERLGLVTRDAVATGVQQCARIGVMGRMNLFSILAAETWLAAHFDL